MFAARPPQGLTPRGQLALVRAKGHAFTGSTDFLADSDNRARVAEYLADLARPYQRELSAELLAGSGTVLGHSYGELAGELIESICSPDEPVDLLILAFAVHDLRPGRQTAAYLSHRTPGAPMAFAICDQGSAAAFSGVRIASEYTASAGLHRALVVVVEQAALPYQCPVPLPARHQGVAMLLSADVTDQPSLTEVRQLAGVPAERVADVADAELAALTAGCHDVGLVLSNSLGAVWTAPAAKHVQTMPAGQPSTDVWRGLIEALAAGAAVPDLLVAADYDSDLRYLSLAGFRTGAGPSAS